jgi:hypothetical protein
MAPGFLQNPCGYFFVRLVHGILSKIFAAALLYSSGFIFFMDGRCLFTDASKRLQLRSKNLHKNHGILI